MAIRPINVIKEWFRTAKKPTQEQFWDWLDSFWHKSDKVPVSAITNLEQILNGKAPVNHIHPVDDITGLEETLEVFQKLEEKGQAEGYASLDEAGKVPLEQLPAIDAELFVVVHGLPYVPDAGNENKIHLVPSYDIDVFIDKYNEYIWKANEWEQLGSSAQQMVFGRQEYSLTGSRHRIWSEVKIVRENKKLQLISVWSISPTEHKVRNNNISLQAADDDYYIDPDASVIEISKERIEIITPEGSGDRMSGIAITRTPNPPSYIHRGLEITGTHVGLFEDYNDGIGEDSKQGIFLDKEHIFIKNGDLTQGLLSLDEYNKLRTTLFGTTAGTVAEGNHTHTKTDVGLSNVDNTSDLDKPISIATQTALDGKVPVTRTVNGKELSADITITKADVGLSNVDNTSDATVLASALGQTKAEIDKIEIGGTNLLINSKKLVVEPNIGTGASLTMSVDMVQDAEYTLSYESTDLVVSNDYPQFFIWQDWERLHNLGNISAKERTFKFSLPTGRYFFEVYNHEYAQGGIINKLKLEKGNKATDWSPFPRGISLKI